MTDKKFNFDLGNRRLTAEELTVVENAKRQLQESLLRHSQGRVVAGSALFKATLKATAAASVTKARGTDIIGGNATLKPRGTDVVGGGSSSWSSNKVAPTGRKY